MNFTPRNSLLVVAFWIGLTTCLTIFAPHWNDVVEDGNLAYFPPTFSSSKADKLLNEGFKKYSSRGQIVLIVARDNAKHDAQLEQSDYDFADKVAASWQGVKEKLDLSSEVWTSKTDIIGDALTSSNNDAVMVVAQVQKDFLDPALQPIAQLAREKAKEAFEEIKKQSNYKEGMEWDMTGSVILSDDLLTATKESLARTEWITVGLVLGFVLLIYRAPLLAIVPLVSIAISWWCGLLVVTETTKWTALWDIIGWHPRLYSTARIFITVLIFGSGTDYCLFLIARYREELYGTPNPTAAMGKTMIGVRTALWGSAVTSIVGMALMGFADFGKFQSAAYAVSICLVMTLAASVTLAPAILTLLGRVAFWPSKIELTFESDMLDYDTAVKQHPYGSVRFWDWLSRSLMTYPVRWWCLGMAILVVPVYWGLNIENRYDLIGDLSKDRASIRGNELLSKYFSPGMTGPIEIVALRKGKSFKDDLGKNLIYTVSSKLSEMEDSIDLVKSSTQPFGFRTSTFDKKTVAGHTAQAQEMYMHESPDKNRYITRWEVVLNHTPFSRRAVVTMQTIEKVVRDLQEKNAAEWKDIEFNFGGSTAVTRDLERLIGSDQTRIQRVVIIGVLFVMLVFIRRAAICFYLMATILLSYFATVGISERLFMWLQDDPNFGVDWKVPLFLFVVLAAVGVDYNIYMVARVLEEQKKHNATDGLRVGLARTGGIITSCGLIMAASFVAMIWGTLFSIVELGTAFTLGILLDTLIIRTIIVPSGWRLGILLTEKFRGPETPQTNTSQS